MQGEQKFGNLLLLMFPDQFQMQKDAFYSYFLAKFSRNKALRHFWSREIGDHYKNCSFDFQYKFSSSITVKRFKAFLKIGAQLSLH